MPYQLLIKSPISRTVPPANASPPQSNPLTTVDNFKARKNGINASTFAKKITTPPIHPKPVVIPHLAITTSTPLTTRVETAARSSKVVPCLPSPQWEQSHTYRTPHPQITIDPIHTTHIPSLSRITGLLLPIKYSNSFYTACITDPIIASISRVAIYRETAQIPIETHVTKTGEPTLPSMRPNRDCSAAQGKVIGGIQCRLEQLFESASTSTTANCAKQNQSNNGITKDNYGTALEREPTMPVSSPPSMNLYIQTLHLLSPYRGIGVATSLLDCLLYEPLPTSSEPTAMTAPPNRIAKRKHISKLVKHYNIRTITAHVHETNDDALRWYAARGFRIEEGIVENYYRRLKPTGARVVRLDLEWNDNDGDYSDYEKIGDDNGYSSLKAKKLKVNTLLDGKEKDKGRDDDFADWVKVEYQRRDPSPVTVCESEGCQHVDGLSGEESPVSEAPSSSLTTFMGDREEDINKKGKKKKRKSR
jgi:N-alpha-acetyltransferase 50